MGKVAERLRLARSRARERRVRTRRYFRDMSLKTAFIWYVLVAAALATAACSIIVNALDGARVEMYFKYQDMGERIEVPPGGRHDIYVSTEGSEVYTVYDAVGKVVAHGEVAYGEGSVEIGLNTENGMDSATYSLIISPTFSAEDRLLDRILATLQAACLPGCYLGALFLCAVAFWRRKLDGPIRTLTDASSRIARSDLDFHIEAASANELGRLCSSFEYMRAALDRSAHETWAQMEERRRLSSAFAHDLRTPLTVLKGRAAMLASELPSGALSGSEAAEEVKVMQRHIARLERYVDAMANVQRLEDVEPQPRPVKVAELARELAETAAILCPALETHVERSGALVATVDAEIVLQVAENILSNASRYARKRLDIALEAASGALTLAVTDDGPGFSAEALARASAPFYKGRESGPEHLGLGLNICDILCRRHGGALTVSNAAGGAKIVARFENTRGTASPS